MNSLSIVVPAFNEARTIRGVVERLLALKLPVRLELLVVDDGSTDGTADALSVLRDARLKVLRHPKNRGKGAAVRTALEQATGDYLLVQDADLEYDPEDIPRLLELAAAGAPAVYGSRILRTENPASYRRYYWGGRFISLWTSLLFLTRITDEPTCYKLVRTELLRSLDLQCTGFEFCPEVTAKLLKRGHLIVETPIRYRPRSIEEGKKIRWKDGVIALWTLLKIRLVG
ncbi:MAG: glycosyltransferase family 2 protein [Elusimicrobiota bacterium]